MRLWCRDTVLQFQRCLQFSGVRIFSFLHLHRGRGCGNGEMMDRLCAGKIVMRMVGVGSVLVCLMGGRLLGETCGFSPQNLRAAAAYSAAHGGLSLLVIQNNRVLFEQYANGHSA